ncbi:MAG: VWA domain-containing protein [Candidatus Aminicenantes bacterium]|nr:VWA domain-containing protein [Candidatus Aminicenantes bacterium]
MKKHTLSLLCLCLLIPGILSSLPQKQEEIQPEKHEVTVSLVLVDVVASDNKGNFITNLTKDDFELYEDGKKVPINSFELISFLREEIEEQEIRLTPARESQLFVIFDSINTIKRVLERNKHKIIDRLTSLLRIGKEIMVCELGEKEGMQILQPLSKDKTLIAQAVHKASGNIWLEREADHLVTPSIMEQASRDSGTAFDVETFKEYNRETYHFFARKRFEKTINGLLAVMNVIKDYPGRKPVLLISGGIPSLSAFASFGIKKIADDTVALSETATTKMNDPFNILKKPGTRRGEDILNDFIHFANSHNITFYALDPDNYLSYVMDDMAYENFPRSGKDISLFSADEIKELKKGELANLNALAEDTGGNAFMGAKKFDNFQKVITRDLSYCYELSFYPNRKKADGKYHKIEVKVKQPGIKILARKGYLDYTDEQRESLLFASASYNPSLFKQISFEAQAVPFVQSKNRFILWVNMALPVKSILHEESEGLRLKKLKLSITIDDLANERGVASQVDIPIILTPSFRKSLEKARYFGFNTCSQPLELKKDEYLLILALFDESRGQMGTVEEMVKIPVMDKDEDSLIVNAVFGDKVDDLNGGGTLFSISPKNGTLQLGKGAFYPMGLNQFKPRKYIALFLQVYSPQKQAAFEPGFFLLQNGEEKVRLRAEIIDESWNKKAKIWNAVFSLDFSGSSKGDHILIIKLLDPQTGQETEKKVEIKII